MKIYQKKAMTFVEVMMALLISTFIMGGLYTTLIVGNRSWLVYTDTVILRQEIRRALFLLSSDLRDSKNVHIVESADNLELSFYRPSKGDIIYDWEKTGEKAHQLTRRSDSGEKLIAQNIKGFSAEENSGAIQLMLLARKKSFSGQEIEYQLGQTVALRYKNPIFK